MTELCRAALWYSENIEIDSIKNPRSGKIFVLSVGEIIRDDENSKGEILIYNFCKCSANVW